MPTLQVVLRSEENEVGAQHRAWYAVKVGALPLPSPTPFLTQGSADYPPTCLPVEGMQI